jgi:uncharacterized protein YlxW (UPF0749 family)
VDKYELADENQRLKKIKNTLEEEIKKMNTKLNRISSLMSREKKMG